MQFYPYPELEIKKYAQGQELLIFAVFLKNWPTEPWGPIFWTQVEKSVSHDKASFAAPNPPPPQKNIDKS